MRFLKFLGGLGAKPITPQFNAKSGDNTKYDDINKLEPWDRLRVLVKDPHQIQYITEPTPEEVDYCLRLEPSLIMYIREQKNWMCELAVTSDPSNIRFVKNPTDEMLLYVLTKDARFLSTIDSKLATLAIEKDPNAIKIIEEHRNKLVGVDINELRLKAVSSNGLLLEFINEQTPELCDVAVEQNPNALGFVRVPKAKYCKLVKDKFPYVFCVVVFKNPMMCGGCNGCKNN